MSTCPTWCHVTGNHTQHWQDVPVQGIDDASVIAIRDDEFDEAPAISLHDSRLAEFTIDRDLTPTEARAYAEALIAAADVLDGAR